MKINYLIPVILAFFALTSCKNDDETTVKPRVTGSIGGDITTNTTYAKGDYVLDGPLLVKSGATLTIEAGTIITAKTDDSKTDYIFVEKGAKIIAVGTAAEPIVLTASVKKRSQWGGLLIIGDASIKTLAGATTGTSEFGAKQTYGGTVDTDNSGILKYVQVLYAGATTGIGVGEFNGFSFYAVGSGTVLENLVAANGGDDGFEFYGGTVSAKNLISYGNTDDSFDWEGGWKGQNNTNWFAYQKDLGNYGMEIEANSQNNTFFPVIKGITLKRADGTTPETAGTVQYDAIQFKAQGNGDFDNVKIVGYNTVGATGVRIQDVATNTDQVNGSKITLTNMNIDSAIPTTFQGLGAISVTFPSGKFTTNGSATGATLSAGNWSKIATEDGMVDTLSNL
jgi:hypothetical protein